MFTLNQRRVALALLLVLGAFGGGTTRAWAQAADVRDYPIPAGQFFTEALPDHNDGAGFAVQERPRC
jgi:hypothetical protein